MSTALVNVPEAPADSRLGRHIICSVDQLQPHPSLIRLGIVPSAHELTVAFGQRDLAMEEPLTITQDHYILAG